MSTCAQKPIAVVGPGSIGTTIAALLYQSGHLLLLCGHTPRAQLGLLPDGGEPVMVPGPVRTNPADVTAPVDVVMLAVKATQLDQAGDWLKVLCDHHTVVCVFQNGIEQVEFVQPHCPSSRVIPAISWFPAETHAEGWVRLRGQAEITLPASAGMVADLLRSAGCTVEVVSDFTTPAWQKLTFNAAGALMGLTGRRSAMFRRDDIAKMTRHYLAECLSVAQADGARVGEEVVAEIIDQYRNYPLTSQALYAPTGKQADRWSGTSSTAWCFAKRVSMASPHPSVKSSSRSSPRRATDPAKTHRPTPMSFD